MEGKEKIIRDEHGREKKHVTHSLFTFESLRAYSKHSYARQNYKYTNNARSLPPSVFLLFMAIALFLPLLLSQTGLAAPTVARPADGSRVRAQDVAKQSAIRF